MALESNGVTPEDHEEPVGSSPVSATPSPTASSPFVGNTGPGFDPSRAQAAGPTGEGSEPAAVALEIPIIPEEQVRSILENVGDGAHAVIGVGELDWVMTEKDQGRIAPPLTRIINKHEQLARVAGHSDELAVAIGAGLYTWRSLLEREGVLKQRRDAAAPVAAAARPQPAPQPPAPPPEPAREAPEPGEGEETDEWGGVTVARGYTPESERRFGRRP